MQRIIETTTVDGRPWRAIIRATKSPKFRGMRGTFSTEGGEALDHIMASLARIEAHLGVS